MHTNAVENENGVDVNCRAISVWVPKFANIPEQAMASIVTVAGHDYFGFGSSKAAPPPIQERCNEQLRVNAENAVVIKARGDAVAPLNLATRRKLRKLSNLLLQLKRYYFNSRALT